jgi:hypothetical protein
VFELFKQFVTSAFEKFKPIVTSAYSLYVTKMKPDEKYLLPWIVYVILILWLLDLG